MKVFTEHESFTEPEIRPTKRSESDKGVVKFPNNPSLNEVVPDEIKEIIGIDAAIDGPRKAGLIHGVDRMTAAKYRDNTEGGQEAKALVIMEKHNIVDLATSKLMVALNLIEPANFDKDRDKVGLITGLSKVIDTMADKNNKDKGGKAVHLHLHTPNQSNENEYKVIEVEGKAS